LVKETPTKEIKLPRRAGRFNCIAIETKNKRENYPQKYDLNFKTKEITFKIRKCFLIGKWRNLKFSIFELKLYFR